MLIDKDDDSESCDVADVLSWDSFNETELCFAIFLLDRRPKYFSQDFFLYLLMALVENAFST